MKGLSKEKVMTVSEIATVFDVTPEALKKHIRDLFPDKMQNGKTTYLTEKEVVLIKKKMIPTTSVAGAMTKTEKNLIVMQAMAILQEEVEELKKENALMLPKADFYDAVTGSSNTCDMGTVAKVLNMGIGRTKLFEFLRLKGVLQSNNVPYQKYIDRGYFRVIESKYTLPNGETQINFKTVVYQSGVDYIRKLLQGGK